jgi:MoxR-like ATPase
VAHLAAAPRENPSFQLGASTRAAIALIRGAQACAMLDDRDFVLPEDVQHMFLPVMAHRMILSPEAKMKGIQAEQFLLTILQNTTVPVRL